MTNDVRTGEVFEIEPQWSDGWHWPVPWWLLAAIAVAVAELTAHPALGVVIFCVKFGLNDWRTAAWLCRVDPRRERSHTLWWFLIGSGCLKIFLVSTLVFPILARIWVALFNQDVTNEILVALGVGIGGMAVSFVMSHIGLVVAWRRRERVWLNSQLHRCRDQNCWPPQLTAPNRVQDVLTFSAIPAVLGTVVGVIFMLVGMIGGLARVGLAGSGLALVCGAIMLHHVSLVKRVLAKTPGDCWYDPPVLELADDQPGGYV